MTIFWRTTCLRWTRGELLTCHLNWREWGAFVFSFVHADDHLPSELLISGNDRLCFKVFLTSKLPLALFSLALTVFRCVQSMRQLVLAPTTCRSRWGQIDGQIAQTHLAGVFVCSLTGRQALDNSSAPSFPSASAVFLTVKTCEDVLTVIVVVATAQLQLTLWNTHRGEWLEMWRVYCCPAGSTSLNMSWTADVLNFHRLLYS